MRRITDRILRIRFVYKHLKTYKNLRLPMQNGCAGLQ